MAKNDYLSQDEMYSLLNGYLGDMVDEIKKYEIDVTAYGHNDSYLEFDTANGRKQYERLCKLLKQTEIDYTLEQISPTTLDSLRFNFILFSQIFYDEKIIDLAYKFIKTINTRKTGNLFDVVTEKELDEYRNEKTKSIWLDSKLDEIQTAPLISLFVKDLLSKYDKVDFNKVIGNKNYYLILPHLMEKIALYEIRDEFNDKHIQDRLDRIRICDAKQSLIIQDDISTNPNQMEKIISAACKNDKALATMLRHKTRQMNNWQEHITYGTMITSIYVNRLFELYKKNQNSMQKFLKQILKAEKSVIQLLQQYEVSITNEETINSYKKTLEKLETR